MPTYSRRSILGLAAALPTMAAALSRPDRSGRNVHRRVHPLEGVARENISITDVKVTLLSYELPRDKQWVTGKMVIWKTKEEIFKEPLVVRNGYMDLPNKPGFGIEVIEGIGKKFPYLPGSYAKPNPDLPT